MKQSLLIIAILISLFHKSEGQTASRYKFEYKIQLHDSDLKDSSSVLINSIPNNGKTPRITGELTDKNKEEIFPKTAVFKGEDTTISVFIWDENSLNINLKPGSYNLSIYDPFYKELEQRLLIRAGVDYILRIKLIKLVSGIIYHVYSIFELSNEEIESMKKCLLVKRKCHDCSRKNTYNVLMEI